LTASPSTSIWRLLERAAPMEHETIRGRLLYTSKKPEIMDKVRGGETFTITKYVDGGRTLRAHCAIDENSPRVLRDSITSFDAAWNPIDGFVRLTVDEKFVGSSWYRFTPTLAECEGYTEQEGRISHRFELDKPARLFGTHPIQADAFLTQSYDLSQGPGEQVIPGGLMCSFHHRGADGPILLRRVNTAGSYFRFVGQETVKVIAGEFEALHFQVGRSTDDDYQGRDIHPPYHVWVTADGDYVMLKAHVTGYMQTYYELTEYEKRKNFF
jgi:hypothetical protein